MMKADMLLKNTHHHYCCFYLDDDVFFHLHVSIHTIASLIRALHDSRLFQRSEVQRNESNFNLHNHQTCREHPINLSSDVGEEHE